jgi:hypothetical protein
MSRRRYNISAAKITEIRPNNDHQRSRRDRALADRHDHLEAKQRVKRDVEQQAREHGRDRRRAFGMSVRQPGMQRCKPDLGSVAEQQEHEGDVEQRGIELRGARDQHGPDHRLQPLADHRPRRHVDQDGAEQRERDTDAAENEIFPGSFQRLVGTIDADHQHRRQCRHLDRDPHQPDIVGHKGEIHREHQYLVHRVIEADESRRQPAGLDLVANVACAEHARGEAHKRGQHDEDLVEIVDLEILA